MKAKSVLCLILLLLSYGAYADERMGLGPGDRLKVTVYGHPDLSAVVQVSRDGRVNLPLIGRVDVDGKSASDVERDVSDKLRGGGYVPNAVVNVLVTEYRSHEVAVLGQIHNPGKYPIEDTGTLMDVIARAGGETEQGGDQIIVLRRGKGGMLTRYSFDLQQLFLTGGEPHDPQVAPGDIIYIPPVPVFYIYGEINKPGVYPLTPGLTVQQAISVGGGLTERGTENGVHVNRRDRDGDVRRADVRLTDTVHKDDVVYVDHSLF